MAKRPTTLPRWALFLSNGALIATVVIGAISFGRSAGRTETALQNSGKVPELQATVGTLSNQLVEIKELIEKQNLTVNQTLDAQNKRIDAIQQAQSLGIAQLGDKINSVQGQMGSVWALAQSDSNKVSELKGMVSAMQMQLQQRKDK
jgi:hypothetical protein